MNKYIKCLAISVYLSALVLNSAVALQEQTPNVCLAPAGDPEYGTLAFEVRDANNILCSELRKADAIEHPINPVLWPTLYGANPYRQPKLHDDVRFRYDSALVYGIEADVFQPCALESCPELPEGLKTSEPAYLVVIVIAELLSFYYRSVCFVSLTNYNGESGDIVARGDSTNEGNIRQTVCPVTITAFDSDSDGDGINGKLDQCINNEPDTLADANGCELSTDSTLSPRDIQTGAGSLGLLMFMSLIGTALGRRRH
jgi:hypothetical protein